MTPEIRNYLLDEINVDWSKVLASWSWLLPSEVTVLLVSRFADLFVVFSDGTVHMLDVGTGSLTKVAASQEDFRKKVSDSENADGWFLIPLVDQMVSAGMELSAGQCYGWKLPPVLGGQFTIENCSPLSFTDYVGACGAIHRQLQDVPDGAQVVLKSGKQVN